jgi:CubicO group peptidase (beta-lactamase class C family)
LERQNSRPFALTLRLSCSLVQIEEAYPVCFRFHFAAMVLVALATSHTNAVAQTPKPIPGLAEAIARGDFPKTTSVLVRRGGALIFESYFGAGSPELLNDTRSATKSVTALAVGAAIADGEIPSVDALAFAFLADKTPFANDTPLKRRR